MMEQLMKDALIKSFMVIFTHDHSQHLLLNKDLIDIAFNCLEFCSDISIEAKQKLAKLISIIFKFPLVQEKLLSQEVILGMTHLLEQVEDHEILRNTVKACTYLSMNYEFVSTYLSLEILKNLIPFLYVFQDEDKMNLIFSISNILKGDKQNKQYFFDNGGSSYFLDLIEENSDPRLVQMCIASIKELAAFKLSLTGLLGKEKKPLMKAIVKCLTISDDWRDTQIKHRRALKERRKSLFVEEDKQDWESSLQKDKDNTSITKDMMRQLGNEEIDNKSTILFAHPIVQIRNNTYFIISRCIKGGMSNVFLKEECNFSYRLMKDLTQHDENQYIFENLMLSLNSLEFDQDYVNEFLSQNYTYIFKLIYDYAKENRIALLKVVINLCLKGVDYLSQNPEMIQTLFNHINQHTDEEV